MRFTKVGAILMIGTLSAFAEDPKTRCIIVSIPNHKLVLMEDGKMVKVFPIAVGKPSTPSPTGTFHIASHVPHPTWFGPKQVVAPGSHNPLGTRWMGLGYKGYGIHGTNMPRSIGKSASHGCIRMRNADVEQLFAMVHVGDEVDIVMEFPVEVAKLLSPTEPVTSTAVAGGGQ